MTVRLRIKELRGALGWSQSELARRAGLRHATINRIEMGHTAGIDFETMEVLADALGVDAADLIQHKKRPDTALNAQRRDDDEVLALREAVTSVNKRLAHARKSLASVSRRLAKIDLTMPKKPRGQT